MNLYLGPTALVGPYVVWCQVLLQLCEALWWLPRASMVPPAQLGGWGSDMFGLCKHTGIHITAISIYIYIHDT